MNTAKNRLDTLRERVKKMAREKPKVVMKDYFSQSIGNQATGFQPSEN